MARKRESKKRGFFWRGTFILLPVAALALACFYSMRQDRLLVEQEAQTQARRLAEEINRNISDAIEKLNPEASFENRLDTNRMVLKLDSRGGLVFPPPLPTAPLPCLHENMTQDQARLWTEAREAEFVQEDPERASNAWKALLSTSPGTNLMAEAWYRLGLLQATNNPEMGANAFMQVIRNLPGASLESGLPASTMATLQWLRFSPPSQQAPASESPNLDSLCHEMVEHPTLLSALILAEAENLKTRKGLRMTNDWMSLWRQQEQGRQFHKSVSATCGAVLNAMAGASLPPGRPHYFWLQTRKQSPNRTSSDASGWHGDTTAWLASLTSARGGLWYLHCIPQFEPETNLVHIVRPLVRSHPHLGFIVELAGVQVLLCRGIDSKNSKSDTQDPATTEWINDRVCVHWHYPLTREMNEETVAKLNRSFISAPLLSEAQSISGGSKLAATKVFLSCPSILYESQRARSLRFGLLIASALAVALGGLFSAWRAFGRQERLAEMKGNFVSSVSHELRAPIASIRLMAEGLESGRVQGEPKKQEYFRFIVQECRRMTGLIENVLDFSRIDQGRLKLNWQVVDIPELVRLTVALQAPAAAEKAVSLIVVPVSPPDENGSLSATIDERAMQQVLVNLIDNAIKHSPAASTVEIGIEAIANKQDGSRGDREPKKRIRIWVQDHGDGIPLADQKHIFEAFYRSGMELRRRTQGTGLGLAIVKHLVEAHHGVVYFQSNPGQGARFTIELP